jgi:hypothetical protein
METWVTIQKMDGSNLGSAAAAAAELKNHWEINITRIRTKKTIGELMIINRYIATTHKENVDGARKRTLYDTFTPVLRSDLERERERD